MRLLEIQEVTEVSIKWNLKTRMLHWDNSCVDSLEKNRRSTVSIYTDNTALKLTNRTNREGPPKTWLTSLLRERILYWVGTDPNYLYAPKDPHLQKGIEVRVQTVHWRNYFVSALYSNDSDAFCCSQCGELLCTYNRKGRKTEGGNWIRKLWTAAGSYWGVWDQDSVSNDSDDKDH